MNAKNKGTGNKRVVVEKDENHRKIRQIRSKIGRVGLESDDGHAALMFSADATKKKKPGWRVEAFVNKGARKRETMDPGRKQVWSK